MHSKANGITFNYQIDGAQDGPWSKSSTDAPEQFRDMAEKGATQTKEAFEKMSAATGQAADVMKNCYSTAVKGAQERAAHDNHQTGCGGNQEFATIRCWRSCGERPSAPNPLMQIKVTGGGTVIMPISGATLSEKRYNGWPLFIIRANFSRQIPIDDTPYPS